MNDAHYAFLVALRNEGGSKAIWALEEDACRKCSMARGLSPDHRCNYGNSSPFQLHCEAFIALIQERIEGGETDA